MMHESQQALSAKLSVLLQGLAPVADEVDREICGLSLDSRFAAKGDLFFACAGTRSHGIEYLEQVCKSGVAAVAWEPTDELRLLAQADRGMPDVPVIAIEGLSQLIGVIADRFYGHPSHDLVVIGVTGTDGKTSTSQFLGYCLERSQSRCGIIGTLGYGLYGQLQEATHTTPDAIRIQKLMASLREQGARYVVMEVSSHGLDQGRANGIEFDIAVLTNLSRDHLDYHADLQAYAQAKQRLFRMPGLRYAVLNRDEDFTSQIRQVLDRNVAVISYGLTPVSMDADEVQLRATDIHLHAHGMHFRVTGPWGEAEIDTALLGRFNVSNLLAVLSVLTALEVPWEEACALLGQLQTVPGRMESIPVEKGQDAPMVVVDYAHTPKALTQVLLALREHCHGKIWCVFGCGGDRDAGKRPLMGEAVERHADRAIITDDNPRTESADKIIREILAGMQNQDAAHVQRDRARAIQWALEQADASDVVLVAGKGHEEYQWVGDRKIPFSDRQVVRHWLATKGGAWK